jgi:hypothetical protein
MINFKKLRQMTEMKGNAYIVSKEISVSAFLRLHVLIPGLIEICRSDREKVIIETDQNLMAHVNVVNSGRTLYIASESKFKKPEFTICIIRVFLRNIDVLNISNENSTVVFNEEINLELPIDIKVREAKTVSIAMNAPSINIWNQSKADIRLRGKCNSLNIKNQGEGIFDSSALQTEELYIKNMAGGIIKVYANKAIEINQLGDGPIYYSGNAVLRDINKREKGEVKYI